MKATSKIKGFAYNLYPKNEENTLNSIDTIELSPISITTPSPDAIIPKGIPIWVQWNSNSRGKIINRVNLEWAVSGTNDWNEIESMVHNHEYYIWNIPNDFTTYKEPHIIWEEDENVTISREPIIKVIPDLQTNMIDASSFQIIDPGYFITDMGEDASINIQLEMRDDNDKISYSDEGEIYGSIKNNVLESFDVGNVEFPGSLDYKEIDIRIISPGDRDTFGTVSNIKII